MGRAISEELRPIVKVSLVLFVCFGCKRRTCHNSSPESCEDRVGNRFGELFERAHLWSPSCISTNEKFMDPDST